MCLPYSNQFRAGALRSLESCAVNFGAKVNVSMIFRARSPERSTSVDLHRRSVRRHGLVFAVIYPLCEVSARLLFGYVCRDWGPYRWTNGDGSCRSLVYFRALEWHLRFIGC